MCRPILTHANGVMGKHEHHRQLHDRRQSDRRFHIVAEHQEGRGVRAQIRQRHAIGNCAHGVFTNTEMQVAPAVVIGTESPGTVEGEIGFGRRRQVRRTAQQPGDVLGKGIQYLAARRTAGNALGVGGIAGQLGLPLLGHFPGAHALQFIGPLRVEAGEGLGPLLVQRVGSLQQRITQRRARLIRHQEARVFWPAIRGFCQANFIVTQGFAMGRCGVVLVGRAIADHAVHHDQGGCAGVGLEGLQRVAQCLQVIGIGDVQGVPTVGLEALDHIFTERQLGVALNADGVVVIQPAQIIELQMPGHRRRFAADAFHHVAVTAQRVHVVVEQHLAVAVEALTQPAPGHGHAHAVGAALAEGAGGGFDAGGHAVLGVARGLGAHLPELLDIVQADGRFAGALAMLIQLDHARQVQKRIKQHRCMPHR